MHEGAADALASAWWAWERLHDARTLGEQASAVEALFNAMSDLVSWHPDYDYEKGTLRHDDN
jgi:hypothetical protein